MSAIRAEQLGKAYRRYARPFDRAVEWLGGRQRHQLFWAVEDVSVTVNPGDSLGIVGDNGAGKSTLLAMFAGAATPTTGRLEVSGRVGSILELGAGFHGEFTGRENIFLAGAAQGFSRPDISRRLDEIIAFSELGDFIERPVRTYSTGMFLRLAFSLATSVEPDVLVIDEALAVGDQRFQAKCAERIERFVSSGRSLVFCSHNLYQVKKLCQQALWLESGKVAAVGPAYEVVDTYADRARARIFAGKTGLAQEGAPLVQVLRVEAVDAAGKPLSQVETGTAITLRIWLRRAPGCEIEPGVGVGLVRADGLVCHCGSTEIDGASCQRVGDEVFFIALHYPELGLLGGSYHFNIATIDNHRPLIMFDVKEGEAPFSVMNSKADWGVCRLPHVWRRNTDVHAGESLRSESGRA
jgi:lipopolysaccharide transport system ATP-binding protein